MAHILTLDGSDPSQTQQDELNLPPIVDESASDEKPPRARPGPRRRAITFAVIAVLLLGFSLLVTWGFIQSDWLYGTYGEISPAQWERISDLRDQLIQLETAPGLYAEAIRALNNALQPPRPSTQKVLFELRQAARALEGQVAAQQIQAELYALINEIEGAGEPGYRKQPTSTPWATLTPFATLTPTPIVDEPIVLLSLP
jgi:hypothetical protein